MNLRKQLEQALQRNAELEKKVKELEKELRKYKNPNTPPSAHPHLKPNTQGYTSSGKRGAPKGHTGSTRPYRTANELRNITAIQCPGCHSKNIEVIGTRHQQVE